MNRNRLDGRLLLAAGIAVLMCIPSVAQVLKGSISGQVVDPQGGVVRGAQVKATQAATGVGRDGNSDDSGYFRFSLMPAGEYKVEVKAKNFKTVLKQTYVSAGADADLGTIQLSVGESRTVVEVEAEGALIDSSQPQVTSTFAGTMLQEFPSVQENQGLDKLALFVAGVASTRDIDFAVANGGVGFSANGLSGRANDQEIDGQNNNRVDIGGPAVFFTDAEFVQQYSLTTNNFGPEYGRNAGSVVNVITRSGGNGWHGSAYADLNGSPLNSLTSRQKSESLRLPPAVVDEFAGVTIGGPWVKDRLFLFSGFDNELVPSQTNFSGFLLTPTQSGLTTLATCFAAGPSANAVAALTKFGPSATFKSSIPTFYSKSLVMQTVNGCPNVQLGRVQRLLPTQVHAFEGVTRLDFQHGKDLLSGRYFFNRANHFNVDLGEAAAGYPINEPAQGQAVLMSETHTFTLHLVNEARFGFDRLNLQFGANSLGTVPAVSGNARELNQGLTNVAFSDGKTQGFGPPVGFPQAFVTNTWQFQDNWNYLWRRHQLKAGVNHTYVDSQDTFFPNINGQYVFQNLSAFISNTPSFVNVGIGNPTLPLKQRESFFYFGDDWRVTQHLILNLGITWSLYGQPANLLHRLDLQNETSASPLFNPQLPLSVRTAPTINSYNKAIAPSFGFACSVGNTVLRGGYRRAYDPPFHNIYLNNYSSAPNILAATLTQPASGAPNPAMQIPANPTGQNVLVALSPLIPQGKLDPRSLGETTIPQNFEPDNVDSWSLSIARTLNKNLALELRYAGNHARNLFQSVNANPFVGTASLPGLAQVFPNLLPAGVNGCTNPQVGDAPGQAFSTALGRINCNEGIVLERTNGGLSDYHGLQAELRANNLFKQLTLRTSYTRSKTTDNVSEVFSTFRGGNTVAIPQNPFDTRNSEHSLSGLDFPDRWTLNFTESLPFFKGRHGLAGQLFGGWSVSGTYAYVSGQTYTPVELLFANFTDSFDLYDRAFSESAAAILPRPFQANPSAPANAVGIFAQDACLLSQKFSLLNASNACGLHGDQLISLNAISSNGAIVNVDRSQIHFIANTAVARQIFGTPFGSAGRNSLRDAPTNTANFSISNNLKVGSRFSLGMHATFVNVFNHPNFSTIDPFVEDAGNSSFGNSFANSRLTNDSIPGSNLEASRRVYVGIIMRF